MKKIIIEKASFSLYLFCNSTGIEPREYQNLTIELLNKIIKAYPHISLNWLITGEGEMENKEWALKYYELLVRIKTQGASFDDVIASYLKNMQNIKLKISNMEEQLEEKDKEIELLKRGNK
ncbi:hypothetical protein ACIXQX_17595 [Bacteroides fragilis]